MDYEDSSCIVEDFNTVNESYQENGHKRRRRKPLKEQDATGTSNAQQEQTTACWDGAITNSALNGTTERKESKRRQDKGARKSKIFSTVGSCRFGIIQLALADEGIVWGLESESQKKMSTIYYRNIIHARKSKKYEKFCVYYVQEENQLLVDKSLEIELPQEGECKKWVQYITKILRNSFNRPRFLRVYIDTHAGRGDGAKIFLDKAEDRLSLYRVEFDTVEISSQEDIKQDFSSTNWREKQYDAVVAVGGDGTVTSLVGALLRQSLSEKGVSKYRSEFIPVPAKLPLAILPNGTHNDIITSINGTSDFTTAVLQLILGNRVNPDIESVFAKDKLVSWSFNCQYGFPSNVHAICDVASKVPSARRFEASTVKTLSKNRLISYDCDIQYLPIEKASENHPTDDDSMCLRGCTLCQGSMESRKQNTKTLNEPVEFEHDVLSDSFDSETFLELKNTTAWQSIKGSFLWVGVHSMSCRSELAPLGLVKCSHLQDGALDLVLVKKASKKDFMRFLRRHGNDKNQMDLPFVEHYRVQAVRFHQRVSSTWRHRDIEKTEIDYQLGLGGGGGSCGGGSGSGFTSVATSPAACRPFVKETSPADQVIVIDDLLDDSESDEDISLPASTLKSPSGRPPHLPNKRMTRPPAHLGQTSSLCTLEASNGMDGVCRRPRSGESTESGEEGRGVVERRGSASIAGWLKGSRLSIDAAFGSSSKLSKDEATNDDAASVKKKTKKTSGLHRLSQIFKTTEANTNPDRSPSYVRPRQTESEIENEKRRAKERKREEKRRLKEVSKASCSWMLDYNLVHETDLEFCVHSNLLEVFGNGIAPDSKVPENKMLWLPAF